MNPLTPRQIVTELDKYIVGQEAAKRAVAIAIRNRWRRQQLPDEIRRDVWPKNILMIGPTGVGKTEIARRLASLTGSPFIKVEATKYTEVGYHGRDVESMIRDLLDMAIGMVRGEMAEQVRAPAEQQVQERLLDLLLPESPGISAVDADEEAKEKRQRTREKMRQRLAAGAMEETLVEITVEDKPTMVSVLGMPGMEMDVDLQSMFDKMLPTKRESKRMSVGDARRVLLAQETEKLIDKGKVTATAIERVEQSGIVFIDEIDKVAGADKANGPDVSRQGVQRDLLPIVEGSTVMTKHGPVRTDHVLFVAAGAFHSSKPGDLMPELQGRFPIRVELQDLTRDDFVRILKEPRHSLTRQQAELMRADGVEVSFTEDAIDAMARIAYDVNRRTMNIGARRLYTVIERVFEQISFDAPDAASGPVRIDAEYVLQRLAEALKEEDLGRFIL